MCLKNKNFIAVMYYQWANSKVKNSAHFHLSYTDNFFSFLPPLYFSRGSQGKIELDTNKMQTKFIVPITKDIWSRGLHCIPSSYSDASHFFCIYTSSLFHVLHWQHTSW